MTNPISASNTRPTDCGYYHVEVDQNGDGKTDRIDTYYYSSYDTENPMQQCGSFFDEDQNGIFELFRTEEEGVYENGDREEIYTSTETIMFDNETGKALMATRSYCELSCGDDPHQYFNVETAKFEDNKVTITNQTTCPEDFFSNRNGTDVFELTENGEIVWNGEVHEMNWHGYENATPEEKFKAYIGEFFGRVTHTYNETSAEQLSDSAKITNEQLAAWSKPIEEETNDAPTEEIKVEEKKSWLDRLLDIFRGK